MNKPKKSYEKVTMNEWGIPNWRDGASYGDVESWSLARWRWEFFRRRADIRKLFDNRKNKQYQNDLDKWRRDCSRSDLTPKEKDYILNIPPRSIDDQRFFVRLTAEEQKTFNYFVLPNPRLSDPPFNDSSIDRVDSYDWAQSGENDKSSLAGKVLEQHHLVIAFSIDRPIPQQIKDAEKYLKSLQKYRHGRNLKKYRHPTKWLGYLRTLDALEAKATWAAILELHPGSAGTPQTVRDIRNQATRMCFDF